MNNAKKNIKAFTLVELLIVMIIAGIILLSITEGFNILQRIITNKTNQITKNMDIYDAYYNLQNIISNSDSAAVDDNGNLMLYADNNYRSAIYKEDSLLIINFANKTDTILDKISALKLIQTNLPNISDTVAIDINYQDTTNVCWKFIIPIPAEKISTINIEEMERDFEYE